LTNTLDILLETIKVCDIRKKNFGRLDAFLYTAPNTVHKTVDLTQFDFNMTKKFRLFTFKTTSIFLGEIFKNVAMKHN